MLDHYAPYLRGMKVYNTRPDSTNKPHEPTGVARVHFKFVKRFTNLKRLSSISLIILVKLRARRKSEVQASNKCSSSSNGFEAVYTDCNVQ